MRAPPPCCERLLRGLDKFREVTRKGAPFIEKVRRYRSDNWRLSHHSAAKGVAQAPARSFLFGEFAQHYQIGAPTRRAFYGSTGKSEFAGVEIAGDRAWAEILGDWIMLAGLQIAQHDASPTGRFVKDARLNHPRNDKTLTMQVKREGLHQRLNALARVGANSSDAGLERRLLLRQ